MYTVDTVPDKLTIDQSILSVGCFLTQSIRGVRVTYNTIII